MRSRQTFDHFARLLPILIGASFAGRPQTPGVSPEHLFGAHDRQVPCRVQDLDCGSASSQRLARILLAECELSGERIGGREHVPKPLDSASVSWAAIWPPASCSSASDEPRPHKDLHQVLTYDGPEAYLPLCLCQSPSCVDGIPRGFKPPSVHQYLAQERRVVVRPRPP